MSKLPQSYLLTESLIGSAISLVLSIVFVFLIFESTNPVPVFGFEGIIFDSIPQSFAIAFMTTLMPTLLTRRRIKLAKVSVIRAGVNRLPHNLFLRSLYMAIGVTVVAYALHFLLFGLIGLNSFSFSSVLIYKSCYGALLGAGIAYYALLNVLNSDA
jgi:hypothetical protein